MTQNIEISQAHARMLGEIMVFITESGTGLITHNEAAEVIIDWTHRMIKENNVKDNKDAFSKQKI